MKKIINVVAIAATVAALFTSCASGSKKDAGYVPVHPREYTLDLSESKSGTDIPVVYNEYGPNFQSSPALDFTKNIRKDKPKAGDTVHVYYKFSVDKDIPMARISLIDPTVNYWLELSPDEAIMIEGIKAGEIYEGVQDIVLTQNVSGEMKVYISYDNSDFIDMGFEKVNAPSNWTFYDVDGVVTTDVALEIPGAEAVQGPKTIKIEVQDICAFCDIVTGHPWVNGVQIMSEIENYQVDISYRDLLEEEPQPGDKIIVHWKGKPTQDIAALKCMPVDHSESVGWWKVMINDESDDNVIIARDLKANEPFEITKEFIVDTGAASTDCNLRVWYDYDPETKGPGPCIIFGIKD